MGLDNFMDLGIEAEEADNAEEDDNEESQEPDYAYDGEEELQDVSVEDVRQVLEQSNHDFSQESNPLDGICFEAMSPGGKWILTVDTAVRPGTEGEHDNFRDAILVVIRHAETGYNVIEPYPVYRVPDWESNLKETIETVTDNKNELVFCDKCGGVRIIRSTNTTGERIRGCSNYPSCRKSEKL